MRNIVYDIDTDSVGMIASNYSSIESGIKNIKLAIPGIVAEYTGGVESVVKNTGDITSTLNGIKSVLLSAIASAGESDVSYNAQDASFDDISKFYYGYPSGTENVVEVSKEALKECFEKNGATLISKESCTYEFEINGHKIQYSVRSEILKDKSRTLVSSKRDGDKVKCKFFSTSDNPDFDNITNTITYCCGINGTASNINSSSLNVNSNTLVAVVYDIKSVDIPGKVASSTYTADFLSGGNTKNITNGGLYNKLVCVNASAHMSNSGESVVKESDYENLNNIDIVFAVNATDSKYATTDRINSDGTKADCSIVKTLKKFQEYGVPEENITFITNSDGGDNSLNNSDSLVSRIAEVYNDSTNDISEIPINVTVIDDNVVPSWDGHAGGYEVIDTLNVLSWLSE